VGLQVVAHVDIGAVAIGLSLLLQIGGCAPHRIPISIQAEPEGIPAEEQTEPVRGPGEGGMPEQGRRSGESDSPGGG
jgi:hypothetical protein